MRMMCGKKCLPTIKGRTVEHIIKISHLMGYFVNLMMFHLHKQISIMIRLYQFCDVQQHYWWGLFSGIFLNTVQLELIIDD